MAHKKGETYLLLCNGGFTGCNCAYLLHVRGAGAIVDSTVERNVMKTDVAIVTFECVSARWACVLKV